MPRQGSGVAVAIATATATALALTATRGKSAEMTYYRTRRGAKVFAAGVMNFGGTAAFPLPGRIIDNLWMHLSRP